MFWFLTVVGLGLPFVTLSWYQAIALAPLVAVHAEPLHTVIVVRRYSLPLVSLT